MSELTLNDVKETIESMRPIKIIIDKKTVWDDRYDDLNQYDFIFTLDYTVKEIHFLIVSCHHSIVSIRTK